MKNTHTCPKCGSRVVLRIPDHSNRHASGNNIYTSSFTLLKKIPVIRYLCQDCGYVENWVEESHQRNEIAHWLGQKSH